MENLDSIILDLGLILAVAAAVTVLFKKLRQPLVLGYIVAGFLISPNFSLLPSVIDEVSIHVWANIGIVFLMFGLGLEFSFHKIAKMGGSAIIVTATVIGSMVCIGFGVGQLMGWSKMDSIFLGGMLCLSSTMIILKVYDEMGLKERPSAQLVLGALVLEDIAGVFMLIILATLSASKNVSGFSTVTEIARLLLVLVLMLAVGIYLIPTVLKKIDKYLSDETLLIISLALCFVMVAVSVWIGFSSALGAFLAGSILAGTVYAERIEKMVVPIKDFFGAVFFISVGMLVEPSLLAQYIVPILILSAVTIFGQMIFSGLGALFAGQSLRTAVFTASSMVQIGEFSFIIANLGTSLGVTGDFLYPIIVCVSIITTFTTPIFIKNNDRMYALAEKVLPEKLKSMISSYNSDRRENDETADSDWKAYMPRYIMKTLISTAAMFVIYIVGTRFFTFSMIEMFGSYGRIIGVLLTVAVMVPFISLMHPRKDVLYTKLWIKEKTNRLPLLSLNAIRLFIAAFFICDTLRYTLRLPILILVVVSIAIVLFIIKSDFVRRQTLKIESRFVTNFNERRFTSSKREREMTENSTWVDAQVFCIEFGLKESTTRRTMRDFYAGKMFGIMLIRIIRGDEIISFPKAETQVFPGDRIIALGTREQIESYVVMLEREDSIDAPDRPMVTLREYILDQEQEGIQSDEDRLICCAIPVTKQTGWTRKSIKDSGFREKYHGFIVALERGILPIIGPELSMEILDGDLMWVLGNKKMEDMLIADGVL